MGKIGTRAGASGGGRRRVLGFTLIELMIVVAVVAILAAVGYPAYTDHVNRARRTDGKAMMLELASRQERYFFDQNRYASAVTSLGYPNANSPEGLYTIALGSVAGSFSTGYTITATPVNDDPKCTTLTLDSRGQKGSTGTDSVANCWR